MSRPTVGKAILTVTALYGGVGAHIADWGGTHLHNPAWPPHAKFHTAQTMSLGAGLGGLALALIWGGRGTWSRPRLLLAAIASSLYGASQLTALAYPGTALADPPRPTGPQARIAAGVLALNLVAYATDRARIDAAAVAGGAR